MDTKSSEKTAIPKLLESLDLRQTLVTIDAIACEQKNADLIVGKQGNYLLALKNNNKHIYQQVSERIIKIHSQLSHTSVMVALKPEHVMSKITSVCMMI